VNGPALADPIPTSRSQTRLVSDNGVAPVTAASIVIATCNRPHELERCLRSLLAQSHPVERIVVIDDAPGGEATRRTVERCDGGKSRIVYAEGRRGGLADAHNLALVEVETSIVAFTDDDVIADRDWLARIVEAFAVAPDVGCVTGKIVPLELETQAQVWLEGYAGFDKGAERRLFDLADNRPDDPMFPFTAGSLGSGANMAFSLAALEDMGGFDPALGAGTVARGGDDLAAFLDVLMHGYKLVYEPRAVVHHGHPREYAALRNQVYCYGVGLTAYLTKSLLDRPRLLAPVVRQLPRALAHSLSSRSSRNSRRPSDYPRELARRERLGMLAGPIAYLRSRRRARAR
jgi:O-antigen biosynthesis protein